MHSCCQRTPLWSYNFCHFQFFIINLLLFLHLTFNFFHYSYFRYQKFTFEFTSLYCDSHSPFTLLVSAFSKNVQFRRTFFRIFCSLYDPKINFDSCRSKLRNLFLHMVSSLFLEEFSCMWDDFQVRVRWEKPKILKFEIESRGIGDMGIRRVVRKKS